MISFAPKSPMLRRPTSHLYRSSATGDLHKSYKIQLTVSLFTGFLVPLFLLLICCSIAGMIKANVSVLKNLPDHTLWSSELKKYVSADGKVNYAAWSKNTSGIAQYLRQFSTLTVQSDWTGNEQLAYWINTYNAFTIKLVLDHYPIKSIRDLNDGNPWDKIWIRLGNTTYSLNQIENEIIRPQFNDPRIHFSLNCAAKSCPPLFNEAYDPINLEAQLTRRTSLFINDKKYNEINIVAIRISEIFNWYKEDFKPDVIFFLNRYQKDKVSSKAKVDYLTYDWTLNE